MSDQDLRVGLIGAGMMGSDHARRIHERVSGARLVAVGDPDADPARAARFAAGVGGLGYGDGVRGKAAGLARLLQNM